MGRSFCKDTFVTGFALFAMFFGAGNLIFPPYLGWSSASNWFLGFLFFILMDVGLSLVALLVIAKLGGGPLCLARRLGRVPALLLVSAAGICIGPLIAVPRTAATTFAFGVEPLFPQVNSWVFSVAFFLVVILLAIRQSKAVDIIGAVLAPVMLVVLAILIACGVASPLGTVSGSVPSAQVVREGVKAGYQTMDMMGVILLAMAVTVSVQQKGYRDHRQQRRIITWSGLLSAVCLFAVYAGLAYLGATVSAAYQGPISQADLLIAITSGLLGRTGTVLLGIVVAFACLTTAIGLISAAASLFQELSGGRLGYQALVVSLSAVSCLISNVGISAIIAFAAPILDLIYPVLVVLVALGIFDARIRSDRVFRAASAGALAASALTMAETGLGLDLGMKWMPLASLGFGWVLPAAAMGLAAAVLDFYKASRLPGPSGNARPSANE